MSVLFVSRDKWFLVLKVRSLQFPTGELTFSIRLLLEVALNFHCKTTIANNLEVTYTLPWIEEGWLRQELFEVTVVFVLPLQVLYCISSIRGRLQLEAGLI